MNGVSENPMLIHPVVAAHTVNVIVPALTLHHTRTSPVVVANPGAGAVVVVPVPALYVVVVVAMVVVGTAATVMSMGLPDTPFCVCLLYCVPNPSPEPYAHCTKCVMPGPNVTSYGSDVFHARENVIDVPPFSSHDFNSVTSECPPSAVSRRGWL